jgi:chromate transporter
LVLAGAAFTLPAMLFVTGLAWMYVEYGQLPQATWLMNGIQPVVIVIIVQALWLLGRKAVHSVLDGLVLAGIFVLYLFGINPLVLLFGCGFAYIAWAASKTFLQKNSPPAAMLALPFISRSASLQSSVPSSGIYLYFSQNWSDPVRQWICAGGLRRMIL